MRGLWPLPSGDTLLSSVKYAAGSKDEAECFVLKRQYVWDCGPPVFAGCAICHRRPNLDSLLLRVSTFCQTVACAFS